MTICWCDISTFSIIINYQFQLKKIPCTTGTRNVNNALVSCALSPVKTRFVAFHGGTPLLLQPQLSVKFNCQYMPTVPALYLAMKVNTMWPCYQQGRLCQDPDLTILFYGCDCVRHGPACWLWKKDPGFWDQVPEKPLQLLLGAKDQQQDAQQDQIPCRPRGISSGNCHNTETCMVQACHMQGHPILRWKTWRVDYVPDHAKMANNAPLNKRLEKDLCWIICRVSQMTQSVMNCLSCLPNDSISHE